MNKKKTANFTEDADDSPEDEKLKNRITKRLLAVENDEDPRKSMRRSRRMSRNATRSMVGSSMITAEGPDYIPLVD
jgi:hypothetical protein